MLETLNIVILVFGLSAFFLGLILQTWPKALLLAAALACLTFLVLGVLVLRDMASCWDCRSGDMTDGGYAMFALMIEAIFFGGALALMAFGAGVGWLIRNALR